MKRISIILLLSILIFSCEKNKALFVPKSEIPEWLKIKIAEYEDGASILEPSYLDMTAWIRYKYLGMYFFEYHNPISSAMFEVYDYSGLSIMLDQEPYLNYIEKKCCKQFVWKGSAYIDY